MSRLDSTLRVFDAVIGARRQRATDVHVSIEEPVAVRRLGQIEKWEAGGTMRSDDVRAFLDFIQFGAEHAERLKLTGSVSMALDVAESGPIRVHVFEHVRGKRLAIRLLHEDISEFADLGLPESIARFADLPSGLVLFVGPTGAGKSTAQFSLIERINMRKACHIATAEDPIEYRLRGKRAIVSQMEVGPGMAMPDFPAAIDSILRSDPNVVVVGEGRNARTLEGMLQLAEQGRLTFGTVHARDASSVFSRIIGAFPADAQPQVRLQLATIQGVVALRLLPGADGKRMIPVAEVLVGTDAIRNLIADEKAPPEAIRNEIDTGGKAGMQTLENALAEKVKQGLIERSTAEAHAVHVRLFHRAMELDRPRAVAVDVGRPAGKKSGTALFDPR